MLTNILFILAIAIYSAWCYAMGYGAACRKYGPSTGRSADDFTAHS